MVIYIMWIMHLDGIVEFIYSSPLSWTNLIRESLA